MRLIILFIFLLFNNSIEANNFTNEGTIAPQVPGPPSSITIENITHSSAHVLWTKPNGLLEIKQYHVAAKVLHTFSQKTLYSPKWTLSSNILRSEIAGLHPGTKYNVTVRAESDSGLGEEIYQIIETVIADPDQDARDPDIIKHEGPTMTIRIYPVHNNNGPVSFYRIVVMNIDQMVAFQPELLQPYEQAVSDDLSYYIAADVTPEDESWTFIVGDRRRYNGFYNGPLHTGERYKVFVGVVSTLNGLTKVRYPASVAERRFSYGDASQSEGTGLVVGLAVAVAIASLLLIIAVVVLVLLRRRVHRNRRQRLSDNQELCIQGAMIQVANHGYIPDDDAERVNHYDALKQAVWNIPRDCLQVDPAAGGEAFLGFGKFGHVVKGAVRKLNERVPTTAACYVVTDGDLTHDTKRAMLRQLGILVKAGKHKNLASLIGTCETPETVFIVLEHNPLVFKDMLLNHRHIQSNGKFTSINEIEVLDLLLGIAEGMQYLSEKHVIHERLCARNVFIFDERVPKVTGHGVSHYNRSNAALDFTRWTAQEALSGKPYSVKSDIWSYGCLMWEACCLGGTPYSHLDAQRVSYEVCRGLRLPKLPYIGEEFYQSMINCWQCDPDERPTFHDIINQLNYFKDTLKLYLHLSFDTTAGFTFESYVPTMEVAEENICLRSINS